MYKMITYREWTGSAFGEPPALGGRAFANALGARARERAEAASAAQRNRCARSRRLASEASDRKARGILARRPAPWSVTAPSRRAHILAALARTEGHSSDCLGPRRNGCRAAHPTTA